MDFPMFKIFKKINKIKFIFNQTLDFSEKKNNVIDTQKCFLSLKIIAKYKLVWAQALAGDIVFCSG